MEKIICLDDNDEVREFTSGMLDDLGYEVYYAESKEVGYGWIIDNRPDLIISDINSPGMNGLEFLQLLKSNPYTSGIPFIFLTGMADLKTAREAKRLGATDFISKPFDLADLRTTIERILAENSTNPLDPSAPPQRRFAKSS